MEYSSFNPNLKAGSTIYGLSRITVRLAYWKTAISLNMIAADPHMRHKIPQSLQYSKLQDELSDVQLKKIMDEFNKVMEAAKAAAGEGFVFYWVDTFYVHQASAGRVTEAIQAAGFEVIDDHCSKVEITHKKILATITRGTRALSYPFNLKSDV